jgi:hypothetical protein
MEHRPRHLGVISIGNSHARGKGSPKQRVGLAQAALGMREGAKIFEQREDIQVRDPKGPLSDGDGFSQNRLGSSETPFGLIVRGEYGERVSDVGVVWTKRRFAELDGVEQPALDLIDDGRARGGDIRGSARRLAWAGATPPSQSQSVGEHACATAKRNQGDLECDRHPDALRLVTRAEAMVRTNHLDVRSTVPPARRRRVAI